MRAYNFKGQGIILNYHIINDGIEIYTVINGTVIHALYNKPNLLDGYEDINDLIDDLSYDFIERLGIEK
jgi:hypothetical protein